jgi:enoyl-CoA hydratase
MKKEPNRSVDSKISAGDGAPEAVPSRHREYRSLHVSIEGQVATVRLHPQSYLMSLKPPADIHQELGPALNDLRTDHRVRIVIITGAEDGEFMVARPTSDYAEPKLKNMLNDPAGAWRTFMGILQCHQVMAEIEKPIIAKVNGDAIGFGQSIVFASDLVVAWQDAKICDVHLAMGEATTRTGKRVGPPFGMVPGDGAGSLLPLLLPLPIAKQYLWLSEEWTAADFAKHGLINQVVPQDGLDEAVSVLAKSLLKRSAFALAWSKRLMNRHIVDQLNRTLDASVAYEMVNLLQVERLGYVDPEKLD